MPSSKVINHTIASDGYHIESVNNLNRPLQISTITACCNAPNVIINLKHVYDNTHLSDTITYIELGNLNKGFAKKNNKKKRKKKPIKQFFNQLTLIIFCDIYKKLINVKIFLSGAIQITGLKSRYEALYIIKKCELIIKNIHNNHTNNHNNLKHKEHKEHKEHILQRTEHNNTITFLNKQETFIYSSPKIVLINSDFTLFRNTPNLTINRNELYKIINKLRVFCSYEPCIYPGVNIKFYYNLNNNKHNGICYCKEKCMGKGNNHTECKRVTIVVFQSSKVIITGANNHMQLMMTFIWIKNLVFNNIDKILVTK